MTTFDTDRNPEPPTLPSLSDASLPVLAARLLAAPRVLLSLDYDGTLVPVRGNGAGEHSPGRVRRLLESLQAHPRIVPALVTGRALAEIKAFVPIEGFAYAGEHGMDIDAPGLRTGFVPEPEVQHAVERVLARWRELETQTPGTLVQVKSRSGSFHFKGVAAVDCSTVEAAARACGADEVASGLVTMTGGVRIVELRPRGGWHKGDGIRILSRWLRERFAEPAALSVFIGDDLTDEDAFRTMHHDSAPALAIRVSADPAVPTHADARLSGVEEVLSLLEALAP